ncbi:anti-sigma factor [Paenibacillus qinlingensis]|uniref:anti-sigma factor n=1 Tax=Paenibacillus qinlingensis TaxID=1837343 RepID=UPI0015664AE0|nr:anti-sigma factor [Paenibacillus qinlingensis]NQX61030.1 anti-sigma factor [Paenibacillus qinlingensis]
MKEQQPVDCSYLINYLTGECTEWERAAFERHLRTCVTCSEELPELQAVWQSLPYQMEEVEVPPDLKGQVMQAIRQEPIDKEEIHKKEIHKVETTNKPIPKRRSFVWLYGATAVVVLGIVVGAIWNYDVFHTKETASKISEPSKVVNTFKLTSADTSMPAASGTAWVVQYGDVHKVVVNLSGLNETSGDWTYQVWLNHNGKKYNCGTLRVDNKGVGVLSYDVHAKSLNIDSIGVTLEPDPNGSQPRGKKVLGSV